MTIKLKLQNIKIKKLQNLLLNFEFASNEEYWEADQGADESLTKAIKDKELAEHKLVSYLNKFSLPVQE